MAIYTDRDFEIQKQLFDRNFRNETTFRTEEQDEADQNIEQQSNLYSNVFLDAREIQEQELEKKKTLLTMPNLPQGVQEIDEDADLLRYSPEYETYYTKTAPEEGITGVGDVHTQMLRASGEYRTKLLKDLTFDRAEMSSFDYHYWQRFKDSSIESGYISAEQANALAKRYNADITFKKPSSVFAVAQSIDMYQKKQALDYYSYYVREQGSLTALQNIGVLGSGLAGAIGPMELVGSIAASIVLPELVVGKVAQGAGLMRNVLFAGKGYKTMAQAAAITNQARFANAVAKGAAGVKTGDALTESAKMFTKTANTAKQAKIEKRTLSLLKKLEDLEKLGNKYDALSKPAKAGIDSLSLAAIDTPFMAYTYGSAGEYGQQDLYSIKDFAADFMLAGGLGVGLPALGRQLFRLTPKARVIREIDRAERNVYEKEALGQISEGEAKQAHDTIAELRKTMAEADEAFKPVDPRLVELSEGLRKSNLTDEEFKAQMLMVYQNLYEGIRPKMHKIPFAGTLFSTINHGLIRRLRKPTASLDETFGQYVERTMSKEGLHSVSIIGEEGLLSRNMIIATNANEAEEYLKTAYKGYVLGYKKALHRLKEWSRSFNTFYEELEDLKARVTEQQQHNIDIDNRVKQGEKTPVSRQIDLRSNLEQIWLKYKLTNKEMKQYALLLESNRTGVSRLPIDEIPSYLRDHIKDFNTFFDRFVIEKETKRKGLFQYDFKNRQGKKAEKPSDYSINSYIDELRLASESNLAMSNMDDYLRNLSQDKVDEVLRAVSEYDTTPDTTIHTLFGIQRRTHAEWKEIQRDADIQDFQVSIQEESYNKLFETENGKQLKSLLIAFTDADKETKSRLNKAMLLVDTVKEFKQNGIVGLQSSIVKALYGDRGFQNFLRKALDNQDFGKGFELTLREGFARMFKEVPIEKVLDDSEIQDLLDKMVSRTINLTKEDPEAMRVLLLPEKEAKAELKNIEEGAEVETKQEKIEKTVENRIKLDTIVRPLYLEIRRELSRLQLQAMWDITRYSEMLSLMFENPFNASEVLTGAATQTVYSFLGSKRNVEYMTKTSGAYISDLKNRLKAQTAQTVSGKSLLDIYKDPAYAEDIAASLVAIKHEVAGTKNADTDRIAQMILDQEASFLGSFLRFGSNYTNPINLIDRSKLKYLDSVLTDTEVTEIGETISRSLHAVNAENIFKMLVSEPDGTVTYGKHTIHKNHKTVLKLVNKITDGVTEVFDDLFKIHNTSYKKLALMAFKYLDLDKMFDPHHTSVVSLNEARDAVFSGDWAKVAQGDIGKLRQAIISLKKINTLLVGKELVTSDIAGKTYVNPSTRSWVYKFYTGLSDTGAVTKETKAAAVNAFEGNLHFKDYDSELFWVKALRPNTTADYVSKSFDRMHRAYYSLERFGTRPIAMVDELIRVYEQARKGGHSFFDKAVEAYRKHRPEETSERHISDKMGLSQNQVESIRQQVAQACGEQNNSPSGGTRLVNILLRLISSPLLVAAGLKSISDRGTIWSGLIINSLAEGRFEAIKLTEQAAKVINNNRDILDLVLATSVLDGEDLLKRLTNDYGTDIVSASKAASSFDKLENLSRKWADIMLNGLGQMSNITNKNKRIAGLAIEMALGKYARTNNEALPKNLKLMLFRESITEKDWEFMKKHLVHNIMEYTKSKMDNPDVSLFKGSSFDLFIPNSALEIADEAIIKELQDRGVKLINQNVINNFRRDLLSKAYNLIDTSADEMCSIPSNRVSYILRGGRAQGSGFGSLAEITTQYMSFGFSILMNTYGRYLANAVDGLSGVTVLDLFNPKVKLLKEDGVTKPEIFMGLFGHIMTISLTFMLVENAVKALQGNIQKPYDEHGVHLDNWVISPLFGSMGLVGTLLDAVFTGVEGSGQRGGGFAIQAAPSVSSVLRQAYRVRQPLASNRIALEDKPAAVGAAIAQNIAGQFGVKSTPVIGPVYSLLIGDWLDLHVKGSYANYASSLDARERRGQVVFPWTEDPKPVWERLQDLGE